MLRAGVRPQRADISAWANELVRETRERMAVVLPLEPHELEFLDRLNGTGEIAPELLTADITMQVLLREHPGLQWKALTVKRRLGIAGGETTE